jgi:predicted dehydrogenase
MRGRLRVGIAGLHRGQAFLEAIRWCEETELVAICDTSPAVLEQRGPMFGEVPRFTEYEQMLDCGLDLVVIATPAHVHVKQAVAALARDLHVFSEVPAATSLKQCVDLVEAARRSSAKYMMAENCCYMKPHMVVSNMARAGLFGDLYYAEGCYVHFIRYLDPPGGWRDQYLFGRRGGTYLTHALGPILDWLEDRVVTVNCVGTGSHVEPRLGGDDSCTVLCRTAKGALVQLRNDMSSPRPARGYASLQGTKGAYEPDWEEDGKVGHRVCFYRGDRTHVEVEWEPLERYEEAYLPPLWKNRPVSLASQVHGGADGLTFLAFVEAIAQDTDSPIDVYRALDMTVPGLVSEISAHQGGAPVAVPNFRHL